eukprot:GSMAST32.ASY1.ANO1.15.1 assembled CDS
MLLVAGLLYLYRNIYGESITALPMNGGCYNVLINTTSKKVAAAVACLSILSYIATGVVSAMSATQYLQTFLEDIGHTMSDAAVVELTICLLFTFALLNFMGISESAGIALYNFKTLAFNWNQPLPPSVGGGQATILSALFFGYASAMLGISGFESSSQFVEEQKEGVFLLTLRN